MSAPHALICHLRRLVSQRETAQADRTLLEHYLENRDETAFAALVQRHGPMVLAVCQAVLRHRHDAEDALQATFLVLARRGRSIRQRDCLGSWLHGVAYRVAQKARVAAARRQAREAMACAPHAPALADDLSWREVRSVLHAELAALPERIRAPLVLCYLQGLTQDEAAQQLGTTPAAVKGRLRRGRELLRRRLEARGLSLAAALAATALTGQALAAPLAQATVHAVTARAPAAAAALAGGVLSPLLPGKLQVLGALILLAGVLVGGVSLLARRVADAAPPAPPVPAVTPAAAPAEDAHGDPLPDGAAARLGTTRFNHGDGLNALYFLPDGKTILSEGSGFVCLWDAATGKELKRSATARPSFDERTVLSADGKTLTFLDQDNAGDIVRLWDVARGTEQRAVPLGVFRREISVYRRNALAPDGKLCAVHTPKQIRVFETAAGKQLWALPNADDGVRAVIFAGPARLVTSDKKHVVSVYEAATGKLVRRFAHGAPAEILVASTDGRLLASLEHHNHAIDRLLKRDVVHVWDVATGTQKHVLAAPPHAWYMSLRFSPGGKLLLTGASRADGDRLLVWDTATGRQLREFVGVAATAMAVSADSARLAEGAGPGKFEIWDLKTGRCLSGHESRHARAAAVVLSERGERAYTIGYSSISTWAIGAGRRLCSFDTPSYPYVDPHRVLSPGGRFAVTFTGDFQHLQILVWDVAAGRLLHKLRPPNVSSNSLSCAFAPDASLLATWHAGKEAVVRLWDVRTGKELHSFPERTAGWPGRLSFAAAGKTLIVAGRRTAGYDIATGKELFSWRIEPAPNTSGVKTTVGGGGGYEYPLAWRTFAVAPDGKTGACILAGEGFGATPTEQRIVLCDAGTGQVIRRWGDSGVASRWREQLRFSPDGRLLASSDDNLVHLWEVATGKEVRAFVGHRGQIQSLAFSGDGRRLASASSDSTVLIWDLAPRAADPSLRTPGERTLAAWWADLARADAARAQAAVWRLADAPAAAVPFLARHLRPVREDDMKALRQEIADLDSDAFPVRQQAFERLKTRGHAAVPALRRELERKTSLEVRRRVEQLLARVRQRPPSGEWLRTLRALTALEHAQTPEARQLLRTLADGAAGALLTEEASAVCQRFGLRAAAAATGNK
jgi:RNA polymerase sigma factor (sigma-70 family)